MFYCHEFLFVSSQECDSKSILPWQMPCGNSGSVWEFHPNAISLPRFFRILPEKNRIFYFCHVLVELVGSVQWVPKVPKISQSWEFRSVAWDFFLCGSDLNVVVKPVPKIQIRSRFFAMICLGRDLVFEKNNILYFLKIL